jgi:hypothetical protein
MLGAVLIAPAAQAARPSAPVVLIGIPGLQWADLSADATPNLWKLAGQGSIASLSVRTVGTWTCPADGWLTVSAGTRAAYPRLACGRLGDPPIRNGGGWYTPAVPAARQLNMKSNFRAAVGALGDAAHQAGRCTAAVGPGAALVAADSRGLLDSYTPDIASMRDWSRCAITAVDLETVVRPYLGAGVSAHQTAAVSPAARAQAVRDADAQVGQVLAALPAGANAIVAGLSDQSDVPHLRAVIAAGPAFRADHYLRSPSTRRAGMVILPDLPATILTAAGIKVPDQVVGIAWTDGGGRGGLDGAVTTLHGQDTAAQTLRATLPTFFAAFVVCQLLAYGIAFVTLRTTRRPGGRRWISAAARGIALAGAATPAATYLVNLVPWWRAPQPTPTMYAVVLAFVALLVALALGGPWRRDVMLPGTILAGITAGVSGSDLLRGSPLQMNSLMGYSPLVGGRYYGLGNIAFATFATGTLFFAAGLAQLLVPTPAPSSLPPRTRLLNRDRRGAAVAVVIALGACADVMSGSPGLGAKFGGTIALVPGTAVTALIVAGKRVTPLRVGFFAGLGVLTVVTICYLDYLRPPGRRTHLGRFADQVMHGEAVPVVTRKMQAMLHTVGNIPLTLLVAAGLAFLFFALIRGGPLSVAYEQAPALRAGLTGTLVTSMSGFAVEDSGIAVPAIALTLAVPLTFAASVRARRIAESRAPSPEASVVDVSPV